MCILPSSTSVRAGYISSGHCHLWLVPPVAGGAGLLDFSPECHGKRSEAEACLIKTSLVAPRDKGNSFLEVVTISG